MWVVNKAQWFFNSFDLIIVVDKTVSHWLSITPFLIVSLEQVNHL